MKNTFLILIVIILSGCLKKADKEIFLIPNGFKGSIVMVYDSTSKNSNSFEEGGRLYKLDTTGIFISNLEKTSGLINTDFYFESSNGNRDNIDYVFTSDEKEKLDTTKVYAFNNGGFTQEQKNKKIGIHLFIICKPNELQAFLKDTFLLKINSGKLPIEKWTKDDILKLKKEVY